MSKWCVEHSPGNLRMVDRAIELIVVPLTTPAINFGPTADTTWKRPLSAPVQRQSVGEAADEREHDRGQIVLPEHRTQTGFHRLHAHEVQVDLGPLADEELDQHARARALGVRFCVAGVIRIGIDEGAASGTAEFLALVRASIEDGGPAVAQRDEGSSTKHDMINELDAQDVPRAHEPFREDQVFPARVGISARMVVGDDYARRSEANSSLERLSWVNERCRRGADGNDAPAHRSIPAVEIDRQELLANVCPNQVAEKSRSGGGVAELRG